MWVPQSWSALLAMFPEFLGAGLVTAHWAVYLCGVDSACEPSRADLCSEPCCSPHLKTHCTGWAQQQPGHHPPSY